MQKCFALLVLVFALISPHAVLSSGEPIRLSKQPVEVSADRLEASETSSTVIFIGNAKAVQGEMTITGDRLTLHYSPDTREITRVDAEGNVRIVQQDRIATAEAAVFYNSKGQIVLTGNPRVSEGQSFVQGHEITLFLDERRSVVTSGQDGRVNAVFTPPQGE